MVNTAEITLTLSVMIMINHFIFSRKNVNKKCEDLLVVFVLCDSKLNIWLDKSRNLNTPPWALGNYNGRLSLVLDIL